MKQDFGSSALQTASAYRVAGDLRCSGPRDGEPRDKILSLMQILSRNSRHEKIMSKFEEPL